MFVCSGQHNKMQKVQWPRSSEPKFDTMAARNLWIGNNRGTPSEIAPVSIFVVFCCRVCKRRDFFVCFPASRAKPAMRWLCILSSFSLIRAPSWMNILQLLTFQHILLPARILLGTSCYGRPGVLDQQIYMSAHVLANGSRMKCDHVCVINTSTQKYTSIYACLLMTWHAFIFSKMETTMPG